MSADFYRTQYYKIIIALGISIILMLMLAAFVLYQVTHRPLPDFSAVNPDGKILTLVSNNEPNYLPSTVTQWANKAAVAAYTFDFAHHEQQLAALRPYFTEAGWNNYLTLMTGVINSIVQNQVFVSSVVIGAPVIANAGDLTGNGYSWQIQMPFLVTILTAEVPTSKRYTVTLTIVKVPTTENPAGMGIDQFVMS